MKAFVIFVAVTMAAVFSVSTAASAANQTRCEQRIIKKGQHLLAKVQKKGEVTKRAKRKAERILKRAKKCNALTSAMPETYSLKHGGPHWGGHPGGGWGRPGWGGHPGYRPYHHGPGSFAGGMIGGFLGTLFRPEPEPQTVVIERERPREKVIVIER